MFLFEIPSFALLPTNFLYLRYICLLFVFVWLSWKQSIHRAHSPHWSFSKPSWLLRKKLVYGDLKKQIFSRCLKRKYVRSRGISLPFLNQQKLLDPVSFCKTQQNCILQKRLRNLCATGGKKCSFLRKIWRALFSWNTCFEIRPFALLPTKYQEEEITGFLFSHWTNYWSKSSYIKIDKRKLVLKMCVVPLLF